MVTVILTLASYVLGLASSHTISAEVTAATATSDRFRVCIVGFSLTVLVQD